MVGEPTTNWYSSVREVKGQFDQKTSPDSKVNNFLLSTYTNSLVKYLFCKFADRNTDTTHTNTHNRHCFDKGST
jgi:hypothetical protein